MAWIIAQVGTDPSGLPTWLAGGGIVSILGGLLIRSELKRDSIEKEYREFIIKATERQWESVGTINQALKVFEKMETRNGRQ